MSKDKVKNSKWEFRLLVFQRILNGMISDISVVDGEFPVSILRGFEHRSIKERVHKLVERVSFENITILGKHIANHMNMRMVRELCSDISFGGHFIKDDFQGSAHKHLINLINKEELP